LLLKIGLGPLQADQGGVCNQTVLLAVGVCNQTILWSLITQLLATSYYHLQLETVKNNAAINSVEGLPLTEDQQLSFS